MNNCQLLGRLTADAEMRQTPNGVSIAKFTVAVNRKFKNKDTDSYDADFLQCVAWRATAEFICKYFHKGDMIALTGSIQTRSWDKDGTKHYATEIIVDGVDFCGSKNSNNNQSSNQSASKPSNAPTTDFDDFNAAGFTSLDGTEDDLPF